MSSRCRGQALCANTLYFGGRKLPRHTGGYTGFIHIDGLELFIVHVEYIRNLLEAEEFISNAPRGVVSHEAQNAAEILVEAKCTQLCECKGGNGSLPLLYEYINRSVEQERVIALCEWVLCVSAAYVHGIHESAAPRPSSRGVRGPHPRWPVHTIPRRACNASCALLP